MSVLLDRILCISILEISKEKEEEEEEENRVE